VVGIFYAVALQIYSCLKYIAPLNKASKQHKLISRIVLVIFAKNLLLEMIIICVVAFFAAVLTFFSGFGLGTLLTPVFAIFFPIELAIALTGVVHFFNNIFKLFLVGMNANKKVLLRFGLPAIISAFFGAWILINISDLPPLLSYQLNLSTFHVTPVKLIVSVLLIIFAVLEFLPAIKNLEFNPKNLALGGAVSGFFGGLSGNQGALRSAFLIRAGLSKEAFIGTAVVISAFVDFTRIAVYATQFVDSDLIKNIQIVAAATIAAMSGAFVGNLLLKKITLAFIQKLIAILLIIISLALGAGII
jgi:uncharacterized protein